MLLERRLHTHREHAATKQVPRQVLDSLRYESGWLMICYNWPPSMRKIKHFEQGRRRYLCRTSPPAAEWKFVMPMSVLSFSDYWLGHAASTPPEEQEQVMMPSLSGFTLAIRHNTKAGMIPGDRWSEPARSSRHDFASRLHIWRAISCRQCPRLATPLFKLPVPKRRPSLPGELPLKRCTARLERTRAGLVLCARPGHFRVYASWMIIALILALSALALFIDI